MVDEFGTLLRRRAFGSSERHASRVEGVDASGDGSIDRDEFEACARAPARSAARSRVTLRAARRAAAPVALTRASGSKRARRSRRGSCRTAEPRRRARRPQRERKRRPQTFRDTGSGLIARGRAAEDELLIDGYDHERTISDPSLLHVHFTDEGFVLRPTRLRHSTVTALMGGKNKYANLSLGACEVTLPSFYDLLSERPMSDGDDRRARHGAPRVIRGRPDAVHAHHGCRCRGLHPQPTLWSQAAPRATSRNPAVAMAAAARPCAAPRTTTRMTRPSLPSTISRRA